LPTSKPRAALPDNERTTTKERIMYVDGFLIPVPKKKLAAYKKLAKLGAKVWREHGALDYCECVADDVSWGKRTSFPRAVKQKPSETVIFSYILYKSRAHRDAVNKKAMHDKRFAGMDMKKMPFDPKRMIWGGFKAIVT
jgi:uncharacterized protein YbaA (DUF1428 family)